jgi:hypothetical protein
MKNSTYIKNNYKSSTIPRLKEIYGFKTLKEIDESSVVTEVLKKFEIFGNNPHNTQDILFNQIDFELDLRYNKFQSLKKKYLAVSK